MDTTVHFNEDGHVYTVGGAKRPSVTGLLRSAYGGGFFPEEWYLDRGRKVHKASVFIEENDFDLATADPFLTGYLNAFSAALKSVAPANIIPPETHLFHPVLGFCGTPDRIWYVRGEVWIIDLKTGAHGRLAELQTAGYKLLLQVIERDLKIHCKTVRRFVLKLDQDGRFKFIPHLEESDLTVFRSAVTIVNDKLNHRKPEPVMFTGIEAAA